MIELLVSVCLIAHPARCKDVTLSFDDAVTPMQCLIGAQPQIAKWANTHPQWTVRRWRCQPAGLFAKI